jgi:hypothetical protein
MNRDAIDVCSQGAKDIRLKIAGGKAYGFVGQCAGEIKDDVPSRGCGRAEAGKKARIYIGKLSAICCSRLTCRPIVDRWIA